MSEPQVPFPKLPSGPRAPTRTPPPDTAHARSRRAMQQGMRQMDAASTLLAMVLMAAGAAGFGYVYVAVRTVWTDGALLLAALWLAWRLRRRRARKR